MLGLPLWQVLPFFFDNYRKTLFATCVAACDPSVAKVLLKTLEDAATEAHKNKVEKKLTLTKKLLLDAIDSVRGAVMICYPMGLPEWDLVRCCLEDMEDLAGTSVSDRGDAGKRRRCPPG